MPAAPQHTTATTDVAWDGPGQEKNLPTVLTLAVMRKFYAWTAPDAAANPTKSRGKLPHHEVSASGVPGAANTHGCSSAIGALNGAMGGVDIPDADKRATYNHLRKHLIDSGVAAADVPELKAMSYDPSRRQLMAGAEREVRSRVAVGLEMRAADGADPVSTGYASVTGESYDMVDWWGDPYQESVAPGAFASVLASQPDTRLLVNHDGIPLARTTSGTLRLSEHTDGDTTGLFHEASLDPGSPLVQMVRSAMGRGDLTQMSFMFTCRADWSPDYEQRTIQEITGLYDVSYVTFPASPSTSAQLNAAAMAGSIEARAARRILGALRERRALSPEEQATVQHLLNLFVAADVAVDAGQQIAAAVLGIPNPDTDDYPGAPMEPAPSRAASLDLYRRRLRLLA